MGRDFEGLVEEAFGAHEVQEELIDRCGLHDGCERLQAGSDLAALAAASAPRDAHNRSVRAQAESLRCGHR